MYCIVRISCKDLESAYFWLHAHTQIHCRHIEIPWLQTLQLSFGFRQAVLLIAEWKIFRIYQWFVSAKTSVRIIWRFLAVLSVMQAEIAFFSGRWGWSSQVLVSQVTECEIPKAKLSSGYSGMNKEENTVNVKLCSMLSIPTWHISFAGWKNISKYVQIRCRFPFCFCLVNN